MMIRNIAAALACMTIGGAYALNAQDVSKVGDYAGGAADINNAGLVLIQVGNTGFALRNPVTGATQTVSVDAELKAQGFTGIAVRDLNNVGQVSGMLNDSINAFLWSPGKGLQVLPVGFGGYFVNDAGVTLGPKGTWSEATGAVALPIDGYPAAFNNAGQVAYINRWRANPGNPGGRAVVRVLSPVGVVLFERIYALTGSAFGPNESDDQATPDRALLNDQGQLALAYDGVKAWTSSTEFYASLGAQPVSVGPAAAMSLNNKGEMVGHPNTNSFNVEPATYLFSATEKAVSLKGVAGFELARVITDNGLILQPKDGATYSLYQYTPGSFVPLPAGTGAGLSAQYSNTGLFGSKVVLTRAENPSFDWGKGRPATGVNRDFFSVKWTGQLEAEEGGVYRLRTVSDDGVRVTVDGKVVINNWRSHKEATDTSIELTFDRASRHTIMVEYYELLGNAKLQLSWQKPGSTVFEQIPTTRLYQP